MNEQIKCPVCGKAGIPDYHKENVVCSCCGTDLSIYKMLSDSQEQSTPNNTNSKIRKITVAALAAIAIIVIVVLCILKRIDISNARSELKKENTFLRDSVATLASKLEEANKEIESLEKQIEKATSSENIYIVKKNDSPCKISWKLYGTESRYKEIEAVITKPLQPGDTLELK